MDSYPEDLGGPKGFIGGYLHNGEAKFISIGSGADPRQGYFEIPQDSIVREMHAKNLIVSEASVFMAKRMVPGTSWGNGINYLEVGTGVGTGTTAVPQAETLAQTALRVPLARKAITAWTYLDTNGNATATETNVIQFTTVFDEAEAVGSIVEMGLFGGNATTTLSSGYMFNYKTFGVWTKGSTLKLTVAWVITF